ncbi:hypothetical protein HDV06_001007 [Boothiomyces sp. JEL0866]|nr:hypothetical protein HDV06_001007 [Boothiomyces sp. JEL0866]
MTTEEQATVNSQATEELQITVEMNDENKLEIEPKTETIATKELAQRKQRFRIDDDLSQSIYFLLIIPRCIQFFTQPYIPLWSTYLLSTITIFYEMYRTYKKGKKYDEIAIPILVITLVQGTVSLFTEDELYLNAPEVLLPLIVGFLFFGSFFAERNLIAYMDGKSKGDTKEGEYYRTEIWKSVDYRFSTGLLTVMWGLGMLLQAGFLILMDIIDASDFDIYSFYAGILFQLFLAHFTAGYVEHKKSQYEKAGHNMDHIQAQELEVKEMILA